MTRHLPILAGHGVDHRSRLHQGKVCHRERDSLLLPNRPHLGSDLRHVASPVDLVDGRKMLCANLLTEVGPGGMYATGFGFLPTELFPLVEVIPMSDAIALLPQPDPEEI
jgi:hypothetical protein